MSIKMRMPSYRLEYLSDRSEVNILEYLGKERVYVEWLNKYRRVEYIQAVMEKLQELDTCKQEIKKRGHRLVSLDYDVDKGCFFMEISNSGYTYTTTVGGYRSRIMGADRFQEMVESEGYKCLSSYIDNKTPILIDYQCGHPAQYITPSRYRGSTTRCTYCSGRSIAPFINDCYTLRPDLLKYFINERDAIGISCADKTKRLYKCPICGTLQKTSLSNFYKKGFVCMQCGPTISFPERYMYHVLKELNIDFEIHVYYDWCHFNVGGIDRIGVYDFAIEDKKLIIEMDGGLGHGKDMRTDSRITKQESIEIDKCKDAVAMNNGYTVIRIDCDYKKFGKRSEYIKNSIVSSLKNIFDLSSVDFDEIDKKSLESNLLQVCSYWEQGLLLHHIREKTKLSNTTIIEYLNKGRKLGLCTYSKESSLKRKGKYNSSKTYVHVKVVDKSTKQVVGVFYDLHDYISNYELLFGRKIKGQQIRDCIRGKWMSVHGLEYHKISEQEYLNLVNDKTLLTDKSIPCFDAWCRQKEEGGAND